MGRRPKLESVGEQEAHGLAALDPEEELEEDGEDGEGLEGGEELE